MKQLKKLSYGQPATEHINAVIDIVNLLLKIQQFEIEKLSYSMNPNIKIGMAGISEIEEKHPNLFEEVL